ncbi:MocR-like pyridoxine biosynthesis transcription factor PdxR [Pseudomonas sp. 1176_21]|uniref:MocR-like pyridoxine biosynthesis transcription factor PdxR n=1 Tax=Pseudomonas sp. 1176_21 TaxID=2604453 RepID=UPI0040630FE1
MARKANVVDIPSLGTLDRSSGQLGRQLAQALRAAIRRGDLKPGEALPSTRMLARSLMIARGTAIEAFEQLTAEGFLESRGRAGTRVAHSLEEPPATHTTGVARPAASSARIERFAQLARRFGEVPQVPFAVSVPLGKAAPDDIWRRLGNRVRARGPGAPSGYGDPLGEIELREAVVDYVRKSRSVRCEASQVIITSGTQQGLYLACQVLLDIGDFAWVEDPAYRGITAILESAGHSGQMVRVPVDAEGMDVEHAVATCPHARAAFVTSSHQYPLGMPMSMTRREALLSWARTHNAWVIEDDYDGELRYAGHPFPSLQGLDPERVIYLGTFSKILFPSLRLGYAIVPPDLVDAFCGARVLMDRHPANADQQVLAAFINEGHLDRHIRRIRGVYATIHRQVNEAVARWLEPELAWLQPTDQGMHLVLWLAAGIDDRQVADQAAEAGVVVRAVSPMYAGPHGRPGLVLGLGGFSGEAIDAAMQRLARVIESASVQASACR